MAALSNANDILTAAMALPASDHAQLASLLWESLDEEDAPEADKQFEQAIIDRLASYDRGETGASNWEEVKSRIEASLDRQ